MPFPRVGVAAVAERGSMLPVFSASDLLRSLELPLLVTGMHLAPPVRADLEEIEFDDYGRRLVMPVYPVVGSGLVVAKSLGHEIVGIIELTVRVEPAVVLLEVDRGARARAV